MKNYHFFILLFLILLLCQPNINAQNWNLLQIDERYHYQKTGDTIPLYTLFIDSVKTANSDSVFYFNRFFLPCDTCSNEGSYQDNQPGFLQREWRKSISGLSTFQNPQTFFIQVTGTVGDSWWFDENKTQLAKVESRTSETIFELMDSVMTISINNETKIKLSKNFGILNYFEFTLSGLEKAKLGKCLLGFDEIFDFHVGDVFQYDEGSFYPEADLSGGLYKWTLKDVIKKRDTLILTIDEKFRPIYFPYVGECTHTQFTKVIANLPNHLVNQYPFQKTIIYPYTFEEIFTEQPEMEPYTCYSFPSVTYNNNKLSKVIGFYSPENGPYIKNDSGIFYLSGQTDEYPSVWYWKYQQGLGLVHKELFHFEVTYSWSMIRYIKDGITSGTVFSDGFMTGSIDKKETETIFYPNPASENITFIGTKDKSIDIQIFGMDGKLIKKVKLNEEKTLPLFGVSNGIYLIHIKTDYIDYTKKLIVQH